MSATLPLPAECERILISQEAIAQRVAELGETLSATYAGSNVRLVTVLRGGLFFISDLCRAMTIDLTLDFLAVSPYSPGGGASVRMTKDLSDDVTDAPVLLVEDIVDTGLTVNYILSMLRGHGAKSVEVCTLFDKPARRIADVPIAYTGFEIPDTFLVGYGLDLRGRYRNLPYVAALRDEVVLT